MDNVADLIAKDEITITLTGEQWGAVVVLLHIALNAGCPAEQARVAYNKIVPIIQGHVASRSDFPEFIDER